MWRWTIAAVLVAIGGTLVPADHAAAEKDKSKETVKLFDGKTLKGWKKPNYGGQGKVEVKDGVLYLRLGASATGVTWTGERFKFPTTNYEVTLEAKRVAGTDFFCGMTFPIGEGHASLIVGGWGGMVCGISCINGFDAANNTTTTAQRFEQGKWYKIRLRVTDDHLRAWIDGERIVDVERTESKEFTVRPEVELAKPFGFTTWKTTGALRNIRLRRLDPDEKQTSRDR